MSNQMEYKCPACGGALAFDSASQQLKCPFCDSVYSLDRFESHDTAASQKPQTQAADADNGMNWNVEPGSEWSEGETDNVSVLCCNSCGGEIVCEDTTASATCPYCGSPVVLKGKLSGMLKPDCIIPFKLDKKQAKEALMRHIADKKFVPSLFKDQNHIDEIRVYMFLSGSLTHRWPQISATKVSVPGRGVTRNISISSIIITGFTVQDMWHSIRFR